MYYVMTENSFDSAHFLAGYEGKCRNIHGHRWLIRIEVGSRQVESEGQCRGMIVDFTQLKRELQEETEALDHRLIYEAGSLREKTKEALLEEQFALVEVPFRPTAECFSRYFYERFVQKGYQQVRATVYETPNNCAVYDGEQ